MQTQVIRPPLQLTHSLILCPICAVKFDPATTSANICSNCLTSQSDITVGVTKQGVLHFCRFCHRYLRPPWIHCERESKELLSLCLKKIRGLNKLKIIDSNFVWTEAHSKRIKIKITVRKELDKGSLLEQTFITQFAENFTQCQDCKKEFTPHIWGACVQVRQRARNKKTFFYIQQLILKHNVHDKFLKIEQVDDGIDFFFKNQTHARRLIDFLGQLLPCNVKLSKQLISHDQHSNIYNYKYVFSLEIPAICKDDLITIPKSLATILGGCSQILLCHKVASAIHLVDPKTLKMIHLNSIQYFHHEKDISIMNIKESGTLFQVVDTEKQGKKSQHMSFHSYSDRLIDKISDVTVMRLSDYSLHDVKTHLTLPLGVDVLAFDLSTLGIQNDLYSQIILVKKVVEKKRKNRIFKLKRLQEQGMIVEGKKKKKKAAQRQEKDYEQFLDDLENDPELRKNVALYKKEGVDIDPKEEKDLNEGEVRLIQLLEDLKIMQSQPQSHLSQAGQLDFEKMKM